MEVSEKVPSFAAFALYDAPTWLFGILTSALHMVWVKTVGGKLETRYRYSAQLCYNTFPFPKISDEKKEKIKQLKLQEIEYLKNAHEGFVKARTTETPPYAGGMNTVTMDYLIGAIAYEAGVAYKDAARILEEVAINPQAGKHIKDNAVDLIALIKQKLNAEKTE